MFGRLPILVHWINDGGLHKTTQNLFTAKGGSL